MNSVNERVAKCRKIANLTQTDMAEKLNIKCSTYSQMERKGIITAERLFQMAEIFGVTPCHLFYGEEPCKKLIPPPPVTEATPTFLRQPDAPMIQKNVFVVTKKEENLIKLLRNLSKDNYAKTMKFIEDIYKEEKR